MKRILVANIPLPSNRFLVDLNTALGKHCDLNHSADAFWNMEGDFDVVHLHFPEYLTKEVQNALINDTLDNALIDEVEVRLKHWSSRASLVVTRHVLLPHRYAGDPRWERLYESVYRYAHGVAHFAQPSIDEFKTRYAKTRFLQGPPEHAVIPHQNYESLPNEMTREEARQKLGISSEKKVMLVFGGVRNLNERNLILTTFKGIRDKHKLLLVPRWREQLVSLGGARLQNGLRNLTRLFYRMHPQYQFSYEFVPEKEAQVYLNAADVLFIPSLHVLNSGNVTLGMTFGNVVVGPDSWNVGHLLRENGNPVFDPEQPETATAAVEHGFKLACEGSIGPANRKLALEQWTPAQCAEQYVTFFEMLLANSQQSGVT